MDYAVIVGLFGVSTAISWRVTYVLFRGIEKSLDEFKAHTNERFDRQAKAMEEGFARHDARFDQMDVRFDRQDARLDQMDGRLDQMDVRFDGQDARFDRQDKRLIKQGESLEQHGALLLQLAREVSLLTGALMGMPNAKGEKERVGSRG